MKACSAALRGGCMTAIISPEGKHLAPPLTEGEGMVIADLDMSLIVKRKRMMDSVGHYARPELISVDPRRPPCPSAHFRVSPPTPASAHPLADGESHESADRAPDQRTANLRRAAG